MYVSLSPELDVIARHAALRTRLSFTDGQLLQVADPPEPVELTPSTVQGASPEQRLETASTILQEDGAEALDITVGPPLRLRLLRLGEADHMLGFHVHHAMCDGWSSDVIMRDLTAFYAARTENRSADLPTLSEQFSDFAAWEIRNYETGGFADEIAYWKEELTALPPPIELERLRCAHYDLERLEPGSRPQTSAHLEPVDAGHDDVEENGVGRISWNRFESFFWRRTHGRPVAGVLEEDLGGHGAREIVVDNDEPGPVAHGKSSLAI